MNVFEFCTCCRGNSHFYIHYKVKTGAFIYSSWILGLVTARNKSQTNPTVWMDESCQSNETYERCKTTWNNTFTIMFGCIWNEHRQKAWEELVKMLTQFNQWLYLFIYLFYMTFKLCFPVNQLIMSFNFRLKLQ